MIFRKTTQIFVLNVAFMLSADVLAKPKPSLNNNGKRKMDDTTRFLKKSAIISQGNYIIEFDVDERSSGAHAIIVFPRRPRNEKDRTRQVLTCMFHKELFDDYMFFYNTPLRYQARILWILKKQEYKKNCSMLVKNYGYSTAEKIQKKFVGIRGKGPFLIGCRGNIDINKCKGSVLIINMSSLNATEIYSVFKYWKENVAKNPFEWSENWKLKLFKNSIVDILEKHGEDIIGVRKKKRGTKTLRDKKK